MTRTWLFAIGLCTVGCSHYPAPTQQVANSMAAVRAAQEAGAADVPEAALHVKLAQEQISRAKELMEHDDNRKAERKALRADTDAELAVALAHHQAASAKLAQFAQANQTAGSEAAPPPASHGATQ